MDQRIEVLVGEWQLDGSSKDGPLFGTRNLKDKDVVRVVMSSRALGSRRSQVYVRLEGEN